MIGKNQKLISLLANRSLRNQLWEISFDRNQFRDDSNLHNIKRHNPFLQNCVLNFGKNLKLFSYHDSSIIVFAISTRQKNQVSTQNFLQVKIFF